MSLAQRVAADPLQAIARADPNNIFNALTKRLVTLELNQTLINNWLTIWQGQIGGRFKGLNVTQEEAAKRVRGLQVNVSAVQTALQEVRGEVQLALNRSREEGGAEGAAAAMRELRAELAELAADATRRERNLRDEIQSLRVSHRLELMGCMLLSMFLSWAAAHHCLSRRMLLPPQIERGRSSNLDDELSRGSQASPPGTPSLSSATSVAASQAPSRASLSGAPPLSCGV